MPPISTRARPRVRRTPTKRILIICGAFSIALFWSYVLFSLWSSLPPTHHATIARGGEVYYSPPTTVSSSSLNRWNHHQSREENAFPDKQNRHLSTSSYSENVTVITGSDHDHQIAKKDEQRYLRAKTPNPQQKQHQQQPPTIIANQSVTPPTTSFIYPLHAKSGTHHAYLYIGTPPQRQTLIVDTGSRLTAFPCQPHCPDCGTHASALFRLNASATHEIVSCDECMLNRRDFELEEYFDGGGMIGGNSGDDGPPPGIGLRGSQQENRRLFPKSCVNNQCGLDQKYTEGSSWKAFEVRDKVWLGSDSAIPSAEQHDRYSAPFVFGCQVSETGLFKTQYADGIMGLSMYTQTLVGMWMKHGSIPSPSFSLCLNRKGGHIALGGTTGGSPSSYDYMHPEREQREGYHQRGNGVVRSRHLAPMRFTPFAKQNVWYYTVRVTSISVGDHVLPEGILQFVNDHKGTIVDSGTTDTFITHKVAKPFTLAWERITGRKYNNRLQKYTFEQFDELPVITFELEGGISWEITPEAYMEEDPTSSGASSPKVSNNSKTNESNSNNNNDDPNDESHSLRPKRWEGKRGFISRVYVDEPQGVVLGSNAMMDKEIYFDIPNKRLGVAKATCAY